tara:strand:- start:149138 stop:150400 length:1263 start_codon:yes stop_codon:yes gene_type:complete
VPKVLGLDQVRLEGLKVLLRGDLNLPIDPISKKFLDDSRLQKMAPSLRKLEGSSVVIMAHQSRPGRADFTDLSQHAIRLSEILGRPVEFVNDICGPVAVDAIRTLQPGGVLVLDNIRMHPDEINLKGEIKHQEESEIVRVLRPHFDLFVNDAFGAAHRSSPSLTGFTRVLPSVAGSLMKDEIDALSIAIENPPRPYVAILGGAKADDSLRVASNLLEKNLVDCVAFLGVVGNFMLVADGYDIGKINTDFAMNQAQPNAEEALEIAKEMLRNFRERIMLPEDIAIEVNNSREQISLRDLPTEYPIYDVGLSTLRTLRPIIMGASCVLWNGPASYFEKQNFAFGTIEVLNMCVETTAMTIIGGGHTSALVEARGVVEKVTHNSTGGGATLTMLSDGEMPVIRSLIESYGISRATLSDKGLLC